jgi:hypothetical protein
MFAVRYAALIALVLWTGALVHAGGWIAPGGDLVGLLCGAALVVLLLVQKFIGPPPAAFFPRLGIVALMLALAGINYRSVSRVVPEIELVLAALLLSWYARE